MAGPRVTQGATAGMPSRLIPCEYTPSPPYGVTLTLLNCEVLSASLVPLATTKPT